MTGCRMLMRKYRHVTTAAVFAAFLFVQFVALRCANQAGRGFLTDGQQEKVYYLIQIPVILGYLLQAALSGFLHTRRGHRIPAFTALAMTGIGAFVLLFCPPGSAFYLAATGITVFHIGFLGGAAALRLSYGSASLPHFGLSIGSGYAAALILQYVLQLRWTIRPALAVLLLLAAFLLAVFLMEEGCQESGEREEETGTGKGSLLIKTLIPVVVITVSLLLFSSYYNSYIHHLQILSAYRDYNVYSWPRLLMVPFAILFGLISDFRKGRLLPLCTLCTVLVAFLNTALLGRETYWLNMCLFYVALAAVVSYYWLTFLRLAGAGVRPALAASFGRVLDSSVVLLSWGLRLSERSGTAILVLDVAALLIVIVVMAFSGAFNLTAKEEAKGNSPEGDEGSQEVSRPPDPFEGAQERYGLTPAETRVLKKLVLSDDKQEAIALELNISVSTLRHHITSIYRKTGVQTRLALNRLIFDQLPQ